ncbi:hypothetical protein [Reichenbachiella sp.]|uniref:hypothetical protein n=1 Tax=Reichenbachiella sp. TaxID=2184521 RepID=UPI003297CE43
MNKIIPVVLLLLLSLCCGHSIYAQQFEENPDVLMDTIKVKGDRFIFLNDDAYYVRKDTVCIIPDTVDFYVRKNNMKKTDNFYSQVEKKMSKGKVSSMMYDYLFKSKNGNEPHGEESSEQRFTPYENESIKHIGYKPLPVFGSNINDTTINNPSRWEKPLNNVHVHTQEWIIRKNTLFEKNQKIDPDAMVDSERLLRRLDYIKDARIFVHETRRRREADVVVVAKDVFPYNFLYRPNNDNDALFGISNINIAGIGHELEYDYIKSGGSEFFYRIRNIEGTFIDAELNYASHFRKTGFGAFFERDFVTQETKYAGGVSFSRYEFGELNYEPTTDVTSEYFYDRKYEDIWVGRAFNTSVVSDFLGLEENTKAVASVRLEFSDFFDRPVTNADTNFRYHDKRNILFSLGLTSRVYFKDKFILQYGRTEDIPTGSALGIVIGRQKGEFKSRFYIGGNYARGGYIKQFGYLNSIFSLGGFIRNGSLEDGIFKIGMDYFTHLYPINQFKFRQFVNLDFSQAITPDEEYILSTQDHLGIRGLTNYYLRATTRLNIKAESLLFTPINVLGFRLATFAFFDYTMTSNSRNDFFGNDSFMGYGGGIRLRNDNLAISTIQLRVGFYPSAPINTSVSTVGFSTSTQLNIRDFDFRAPEIIPFNE